MLLATRREDSKNEAFIHYHLAESTFLSKKSNNGSECLVVKEDTKFVDGIGGTTWDGAFVICKILEQLSNSLLFGSIDNKLTEDIHLVELGCGTGLCGLIAAKLGFKSTLTDRYSDLAKLNISRHFNFNKNCQSTLSDSNVDIHAMDLSWENYQESHVPNTQNTVQSLLRTRGAVDIIVGAEIACLKKQQPILVSTIAALCDSNPACIVFLSFDGPAPPNNVLYEKEMISLMTKHKFRHVVVSTADVTWVRSSCNNSLFPARNNRDCKDIDINNSTPLSSSAVYHSSPKYSEAFYRDSTLKKNSSAASNNFQSERLAPLYSAQCSSALLHSSSSNSENSTIKDVESAKQKELLYSNPIAGSKIDDEDDEADCILDISALLPPLPPPLSTSTPLYCHLDSKPPFILPPPPLLLNTLLRSDSKVDQCDNKVKERVVLSENNCDKKEIKKNSNYNNNNMNTAIVSSSQVGAQIVEESSHHVIAFYRLSAVNTCRRCHLQYFQLTALNNNQYGNCCYHSGSYITTTRSSSNIDSCWDCCGSSDSTSKGCCTAPHISY